MRRFVIVVVDARALEKASVSVPVQRGTRTTGRPAYQFQTLALGQCALAVERLYVRYPALCIITHNYNITTVQLLYSS